MGSTVSCGHGGTVVPSPPDTAKLSIAGRKVLLAADLTAATVTCPAVTAGQVVQCTKVSSVVDAPGAKLTVGGNPVIRDSLTGMTSGAPPLLTARAGQSKLSSVSVRT
ncbi:hypothetical protein [Micromonospora sp. NPDC005299]|uniref:hypothetical protein n=1 Tax=Micromonospora sp. NPDC005299 TaxID=3364231 RepID=UPI003687F32F